MSFARIAGIVAVAALLFAGSTVAVGAETPPRPDSGFSTPTEAISAYGDFAEIGNGSLRCPVRGEHVSLFASAQSCRGATQREPLYQLPLFGWGSNNGYYMQFAGAGQTNGPGGSTLFDESSANLTIPAGTSVLYAQLDWGGDTGSYLGADAARCQSPPYLLEPASAPPPAPAASSPDAQPVTIGVGTDPATTVALDPTHFTSSQSSSAPVGMYSDWADVTSDFADFSPGQQGTVNVGDVWAPTGYGCAAGWSLTVVFGATTPIPGYQALREFDIYAGHLRSTENSKLSVTLAEPNIDPADAQVTMGVTAYDGDWNNASDSLSVDGATVADPCGGTSSDDNFFTSCASGALDPLAPGQPIPNNFSVDAKTFTPTITAGSAKPGDVDVELDTGYDVYLLQGLVVAENIDPSFTINSPPTFNKKHLHVGDTVEVTVTGTNTGNIPLSGMVLTDLDSTDCRGKAIGDLAPGASYSVTCAVPIPDVSSLSDTVTVTAAWPGDAAGLTASDQISFTEPVLGPQLTISQTASPTTVQSGQPATVTFAVTNTGDSYDGALTDVTITEPALPGCVPQPIASLPPGTAATLTCTVKPTATVTGAATATATDDTGVKLTAASNPVTLNLSAAMLVITNYANPSQVKPGGTTRFTVTVHNTGQVPVTVRISDDNAPGCDFSIGTTGLAPQAAQSEECTVTLPQSTGNFTDTATFSANPILTDGTTGPPIAGSAKGVVKITATPTAAAANAPPAAAARLDGNTSGTGTGAGSATASGATGGKSAASGAGKSLAYTGVAIGAPVAAAGALVIAGTLLMIRTRRRSTRR